MESLSALLLLAIGIIVILIELVFASFFIIWLGIALVLVALIEAVYPLPSIWFQLSLASALSIALFFAFYQPLKTFIDHTPKLDDNFIQPQGVGIIQHQMLKYQGSYFKVVNADISQLENVRVQVINIDKNNAWIELDPPADFAVK